MKVNSTVFTIIVMTLVAVISYYLGDSMRGRSSGQQSITSNTLPTVSNRIKAIETSPEHCIPTYQPKTDNKNIMTCQPNKNQASAMLPPSPQNALEDLNLRYKTYQDMAKSEYDIDLANAGAVNGKRGDQFLVKNAQQRYALNVSKIESWYRSIQNKFLLIGRDDTITNAEKEMVRNGVMRKAEDPIYIPKYEKAEPASDNLEH